MLKILCIANWYAEPYFWAHLCILLGRLICVAVCPSVTLLTTLWEKFMSANGHGIIKTPKGGSPAPGSLRNLTLFSRLPLNYFLDAPQNNFSCSLNLFWYLPAPSAFVNLLPELISVLKCTTGVCLIMSVLKCRWKGGKKCLQYKTPWIYGTPYAPCSLNYFLLLPAPWSFLHAAPGSLVNLDPILPAPKTPSRVSVIVPYKEDYFADQYTFIIKQGFQLPHITFHNQHLTSIAGLM